METVDYPDRKSLIEALLGARKRGVVAEVVHNGLTLQFPDGIGDTEPGDEVEPENDSVMLGVVESEVVEDDIIGEPKPASTKRNRNRP